MKTKKKKPTIPLMDKVKIKDLILNNPQHYKPDLSLACFIVSCALHSKHDWASRDLFYHYLHVGVKDNEDEDQIIIGILHDLVEDSDWTLNDLRDVGFAEHIVLGVEALTKKDNEPYFERPNRIVQAALDLYQKVNLIIPIKLNDNSHNMDFSRNEKNITIKEINNSRKYMMTKEFLLACKKGLINAPQNKWIPGDNKIMNLAGKFLEATANTLGLNKKYISMTEFILDHRPDLFDFQLLKEQDPEGYEEHKDRMLNFKENATDITKERNTTPVPKEDIIQMLEEANDTGRDHCLNTAIFIASQALRSDLYDPALRYLTIANKFKESNHLMAEYIMFEVEKNSDDWTHEDTRRIFKNKPELVESVRLTHAKDKNLTGENTHDWANDIKSQKSSDQYKIITAHLEYNLNTYNWKRMTTEKDIDFINFHIDLNNFLRQDKDRNSDHSLPIVVSRIQENAPIPTVPHF